MKPGTKLIVLISSVVIFWGVIIGCIHLFNNPKERAKSLVVEALQHTVDNPESLKIVAVSKPDSVFGRQFITSEEQMNIAAAMMKVGELLMERTDNLEHIDLNDRDMANLMERQMSCVSALRSMVGADFQPQSANQPFSGWKVKIEYEADSRNGSHYRSEHWFILDKDAKFVIQSFEIPLI